MVVDNDSLGHRNVPETTDRSLDVLKRLVTNINRVIVLLKIKGFKSPPQISIDDLEEIMELEESSRDELLFDYTMDSINTLARIFTIFEKLGFGYDITTQQTDSSLMFRAEAINMNTMVAKFIYCEDIMSGYLWILGQSVLLMLEELGV